VPSIRWEALREGIQVAKLLLALRDARDAGELPVEVAGQVDALWGEIDARSSLKPSWPTSPSAFAGPGRRRSSSLTD